MTDRLQLGSIDLIATRHETGSGEYGWEEHDEQPSYAFTFDPNSGCTSGCGAAGAVLTADSLQYIVKPITFTCYSANSKTAQANYDALVLVLDSSTAYSLKQTCSPAYTGAPLLLTRLAGDAEDPTVWTVKRYQKKRTRLDLDATRMIVDVDLYCSEGGPVIDTGTGLTLIGGNGNPTQGGTVAPMIVRATVAEFTRTGGNAARDLGVFGPILIHTAMAEFTRTGGS